MKRRKRKKKIRRPPSSLGGFFFGCSMRSFRDSPGGMAPFMRPGCTGCTGAARGPVQVFFLEIHGDARVHGLHGEFLCIERFRHRLCWVFPDVFPRFVFLIHVLTRAPRAPVQSMDSKGKLAARVCTGTRAEWRNQHRWRVEIIAT